MRACGLRHRIIGLNPLTNGSRIRTVTWYEDGEAVVVSIPLRTGLGFEFTIDATYHRSSGSQSPYERVSDSNGPGLRGLCGLRRLNPLTNGSRIRTSSACTTRGQSSLNPLTNGSRIRTHLRAGHRCPDGSQSPYERVSDSNPRPERIRAGYGSLNPLTNGSRIRTSSAVPRLTLWSRLNPLTNGSRIRTFASQ